MKPDHPFTVGQTVRISPRWAGNVGIDPVPGDVGVVQATGHGLVRVLIARIGQAWWWTTSNVEVLPDDQ